MSESKSGAKVGTGIYAVELSYSGEIEIGNRVKDVRGCTIMILSIISVTIECGELVATVIGAEVDEYDDILRTGDDY